MIYTFIPCHKNPCLQGHLHLGGSRPDGDCITVTSQFLSRRGQPWLPIMGEYHFVRACCQDWRRELAKMKAGGIQIVSTYLFWIYHEELENQYDFSGDRNLRDFVQTCADLGLEVILRLGPYAHGECRNGGFPDWLMKKGIPLRCNAPDYLELTSRWYQAVFTQVKGLLYKDGGPILGVQLENELTEDAQHLATLKQLAIAAGFDVPLYTVTGWNNPRGAEIPIDEVLPVFGGYPEAPWLPHTQLLEPLSHFFFLPMRNERAIAEDLSILNYEEGWQLPYERYPFATCELGPGVQINRRRRPLIRPMDGYALSLIKLGCGNNLVGYYMYHGGTNKIGRLGPLNETADGLWAKDCPVLSYDFQAPLSEFGEVRTSYRLLNILHLFVSNFGSRLAMLPAAMSTQSVSRDDTETLRCALRTDGQSGFVFVSHYQRLTPLTDLHDVVIDTGSVCFPPLDVVGDVAFLLPFGLSMADQILCWATAQPLCRVGNTWFFAEISGIVSRYCFADNTEYIAHPGLDHYLRKGDVRIITLSWEQAMYLRQLDSGLYLGNRCDLYELDGRVLSVEPGIHMAWYWNGDSFVPFQVGTSFAQAQLMQQPLTAPPLEITYSEDFSDLSGNPPHWFRLSVSTDEGVVEIDRVFDAAQIYADGVLVADALYYGEPWRLPARLLYGKTCYLAITELQEKVYLDPDVAR